MKTYTVTRGGGGEHIAEALAVRSYDDPDQAAIEILAELGYEVTPCCYSEDEACAECDRATRQKAAEDAEDRGIDQARREGRL